MNIVRVVRGGVVALLAASAWGCYASDPITMDAGGPDAFVPEDGDAGVPDGAPVELDAGLDAPIIDDSDGDGLAASVDCDDADEHVGRTHSRACENACGAGEETCADGIWGACDAPTECLCEPDATRIVPCDLCGMQVQRCGASGTWEDSGECLYQGACEPGTVDDEYGFSCGHQRRLCGASCTWLPWETVVPNGECIAGESVLCWNKTYETCSPTCTLECRPYF